MYTDFYPVTLEDNYFMSGLYMCLERSKSIMKHLWTYLTDSSSSSSSPLLRVELTLIFWTAVTEADFQDLAVSKSVRHSALISVQLDVKLTYSRSCATVESYSRSGEVCEEIRPLI